jgi:hypothetical protein
MKIFYGLVLLIGFASCDLSTGDDCGPFPERTDFVLGDTIGMSWAAHAIHVGVPWRVGQTEITRWAHEDSVLVFVTYRGSSAYKTFAFDHVVTRDTVLELKFDATSGASPAGGASIDCVPGPDPYFETDLHIFAPHGLSVSYGLNGF